MCILYIYTCIFYTYTCILYTYTFIFYTTHAYFTHGMHTSKHTHTYFTHSMFHISTWSMSILCISLMCILCKTVTHLNTACPFEKLKCCFYTGSRRQQGPVSGRPLDCALWSSSEPIQVYPKGSVDGGLIYFFPGAECTAWERHPAPADWRSVILMMIIMSFSVAGSQMYP